MLEDEGRFDFILQESGVEAFIKTVGLLQSHTSYWSNLDVCNFILMKIHHCFVRTVQLGVEEETK